MHQVIIKENEIPTTNVLQFTEVGLVRPGEQLSGPSIWNVAILPPFSGDHTSAKGSLDRALLIEVDDPDDEQTRARVLTALTAAQGGHKA